MVNKRKKIAFYGGYTIWSAGDDAPLAFLVQGLKEHFNDDIECVVFARHPNDHFDRTFDVKTVQNFEYGSKSLSADRWLQGLNFEDDREHIRGIAEIIHDSDLLVLGAGNFITEVSLDLLKGHFSQFALMTLLADIAETPVFLFGLSANKLLNPWTAKTAKWMLHKASSVTFRDSFAIDNLKASGVILPEYKLLPDAALGAPSAPQGREAEILKIENIPLPVGPRLGVALRDLSWMNASEEYEALLINIIDKWCELEDHDVIFIPQCTYDVDSPHTDDRFIAKKIKAQLDKVEKAHIIADRYDYFDIESLYRLVDISLTTRLHGAVFSAKVGTPPIGLSYEDKVRGFFKQIGLDENVFNVYDDPDTIFTNMIQTLNNGDAISESITKDIRQLRSQLKEYLDVIIHLIEGKQ